MSGMNGIDVRDIIETAALAQAEPATHHRPLAAPAGEAPGRTVSPAMLGAGVRVCETMLVLTAGIATRMAHLGIQTPVADLVLTFAVAMAAMLAFETAGAYTIQAMRWFPRTAWKMAIGWAGAFLAVLAAVFLLKVGDQFSRVWLVTWFAAGAAGLVALRLVLAAVVGSLMKAGRFDRRTAIVGGGQAAFDMIEALHAQPDTGVRIVGVFDDRGDDRADAVVAGYPKLGNVDDLVDYARRTRLDLVIFTVPLSAEQRILQMLSKLWVLPLDIRLSAHASRLRLRPRAYSWIGSVPVLDVFDRPMQDWDMVVKWLFDKLVGSAMLVALSPVMLATAIAVKLDSPGPVFFRQKRYGFDNALIEVFKFRSMAVESADPDAAKLVTRDDPRVTRVGRFIRRTSIDELPQLINVVFKGDLSLVGPRPHAMQAKAADQLYESVVDGYFARHKVKPGITGWAQINGWRGETDTDEKIRRRVEHDLYYIENWSMSFDLEIVLKTPVSLFRTRNAY